MYVCMCVFYRQKQIYKTMSNKKEVHPTYIWVIQEAPGEQGEKTGPSRRKIVKLC